MTKPRLRAGMTAFLAMMLLAALVAFSAGCSCGDDDDDDNGGSIPDDDDASDDDTGDDDASDDDAVDDDDADDDDADDDDGFVVPPFVVEPPPFPEWVYRHWVWEDESTQTSAQDLVQGYIDNDIPVGAIIIDSPWETGYNTFIFDDTMYPDPQAMVDYFHDRDVRVFLWITPNVNDDSPNFQEGYDAGYYVHGGDTLEWWKGDGAYIDYWNEDAMEWWHDQMDNVLDLGIDGWKTDGSEFAMLLWLWIPTADGPKTPKQYQEAYYRDFFNYTREKLGPDRVITARPVDSYGVPWGPDFQPKDTSFAGWVGDQDPTFSGLRAALLNMFMSGNRGHTNFGSDIGGYRGDDPRDEDLMIRWMQQGAFSPIMENGGSGEHRPWMYSADLLSIYRKFTKIHHELIPYLYSQGADSWRRGISLFRPVHRLYWEYMLGDAFFVGAMTETGETREVHLTEGEWIHFFTGDAFTGPLDVEIDVPYEEFPVFVRRGSIVPMHLLEDGVFDPDDNAYTVSMWPVPGEHEFIVSEEHGSGARIRYMSAAVGIDVTVSATSRPYAFRLHDVDEPNSVSAEPAGDLAEAANLSDLAGADTGWFYDAAEDVLWVKPGSAISGVRVEVR
ncbi:hypothetical protein K8I61_04270 [bacterium]|nr:hypothetical protein [bacterium]